MNTKLTAVRAWMLCTGICFALGNSSLPAQTFSTVHGFGILTNVTGFNPYSRLVQGGDGTLYGTMYFGEVGAAGTVFKMQPDGSGFAALKLFTNSVEGANPRAGLVLAGNALYGTTQNGGSFGQGTVFKLSIDGTGFAVLKSFSDTNGMHPTASLVLDNGVLYGTTTNGGTLGLGTVFKLDTNGANFTVLKDFTSSDGARPGGSLAVAGNVLYGTTSTGGSADLGTIYKLNTDGSGHSILREFAGFDGANPVAGLTLSGSVLYGTTTTAGGTDNGGVFKINTDGTGFTVLTDFFDPPEAHPAGNLTLDGNVLYGTTSMDEPMLGGTVFRINTDGTGHTSFNLNFVDGTNPQAGVLVAAGVLYGTAVLGGSSGLGTVFRMNTNGTDHTVLKHCSFSDATDSRAGLAAGDDGVLYGTTYSGGSSARGTVFKVKTDGSGYAILKHFVGSDGRNPLAGLTLAGGVLYGTTENGGSSGFGTIFKLNTDGTGYSVLKHCIPSDGVRPWATLTLGGEVLYGTTTLGGSPGFGTVFKINTNGTGYTVLKHCNSSDGFLPAAGLTLSGNTLYGTTSRGGSSDRGTVFKVNTDGTGFAVLMHFPAEANPQAIPILIGNVLYGTTKIGGSFNQGMVFKINTDGSDYAVLKNFSGSDGANPQAGLTLLGGALYGTTAGGGTAGAGTVFKINPDGSDYLAFQHFNGTDGSTPLAGLTLFSNALYGTTQGGGSLRSGTVFKLDFNLPQPILVCTNREVECDAAWTLIPPAVIDPSCTNPGVPVLAGALTNSFFCPQQITLFWQYTNCLQQTASCNQNIFVADSTAPIPICPTNKTVACGTAWSFDTPSGIDSCWGTNLTVTPAGPPETNSLCPLIVVQMWMIFDGCGNPASCSQEVTLVDTNLPTLVCPTNLLVLASNTDPVEVHWTLSPSATCGDIAGATSSPPSGTAFLPGTTNTITAWTWNHCLLTNSCTFTVTVTTEAALIPALSIESLPGAVRLAWTTNAVGFFLETNTTPAASNGWGVLGSNYSILGTNYVVTEFLSNHPGQFFRLRKP